MRKHQSENFFFFFRFQSHIDFIICRCRTGIHSIPTLLGTKRPHVIDCRLTVVASPTQSRWRLNTLSSLPLHRLLLSDLLAMLLTLLTLVGITLAPRPRTTSESSHPHSIHPSHLRCHLLSLPPLSIHQPTLRKRVDMKLRRFPLLHLLDAQLMWWSFLLQITQKTERKGTDFLPFTFLHLPAGTRHQYHLARDTHHVLELPLPTHHASFLLPQFPHAELACLLHTGRHIQPPLTPSSRPAKAIPYIHMSLRMFPLGHHLVRREYRHHPPPACQSILPTFLSTLPVCQAFLWVVSIASPHRRHPVE